MATDPAFGQTRGGKGKVRIASQRLLVETSRSIKGFGFEQVFGFSLCIFPFQEQVISFRILRWRSRQAVGLSGCKLGLQRIGDSLRNFAFNGKDILYAAVVGLGPKMRIGARVYQLNVDAHRVGSSLHGAFQDVRDSELLRLFSSPAVYSCTL